MSQLQPSRITLSVFGLGKLGSPFVAVMAAKGFHVIGVDKNPKLVRAMNAGKAAVAEPFLQAFLNRGKKRIQATASVEEAVAGSSVSFVIVPTPSDKDGSFTNRYVLDCITQIAKACAKKKERHIVVVTSTVMPGSSTAVLIPAIEKASGLQVGKDIGFCYNPEFIVLGSVIRNMLHPDFTLIGEGDPLSGKRLADIYRHVCGKDVVIRRMSPINAELTKLASNTYVTTKISYANMLAELCEQLPGADVDCVTQALGYDRRIGHKCLTGGTAYGGPCFPRDNKALTLLAKRLHARMDIAEATQRINGTQTERLMRKIKKHFPQGGHIGIAGMAYKLDTPVLEESASILLAEALLKKHYSVSVHDPLAASHARKQLKGRVRVFAELGGMAQSVDALVVMLPSAHYASLRPSHVAKRKKPLLLLDCWRLYAGRKLGKKVERLPLGVGV